MTAHTLIPNTGDFLDDAAFEAGMLHIFRRLSPPARKAVLVALEHDDTPGAIHIARAELTNLLS